MLPVHHGPLFFYWSVVSPVQRGLSSICMATNSTTHRCWMLKWDFYTDQGRRKVLAIFFFLAWSLSAVWGFEPVSLTAVEKDNWLYIFIYVWLYGNVSLYKQITSLTVVIIENKCGQCRKGLVMQPLHKYTAQCRRAISISKDSAAHLHLRDEGNSFEDASVYILDWEARWLKEVINVHREWPSLDRGGS